MNKLAIKSAGKLVPKMKFLLQKHSPEIWLGAGIVTVIGGTVWACWASRKVDDIFDDRTDLIADLEADYDDGVIAVRNEDGEVVEEVEMTEKEYKHEIAKINFEAGIDLVRLYAPSALLLASGIGMIVNGHRILCKRNAVLVAAYTALDQSFSDYRGRVRARYGDEIENEIYTGVTYEASTKTEVDEDGKKKKVKELTPVVGTTVSRYGRFFDEANSKEWTRSPSYNHTFLICQQNSANDKLRKDGYLFLNTVYKMLGMSETPTGAICGWLLPEETDPLHEGDAYVDFRIYDATDPSKVAFAHGEEPSIFLDFNCQGIIYDKI